jgi:cbb3-type cytochrome oxidase subunit 3
MSSNVDEATINPDGSATFEAPVDGATAPEEDTEPNFDEDVPFEEAAAGAVEKGTDPAIFLALGFVLFVLVYFYFHRKGKKKQMEREAFFFDMDGDKFNIKLPAAVEEYYEVKEKCLQAGWEPGKVSILGISANNFLLRVTTRNGLISYRVLHHSKATCKRSGSS